MEIRPMKTNVDYRTALKEIETLMRAKENSPEGDRLDVLTTLVEAFEERRFPMEAPDAVAAIRFRMEQMGLTRKDLEPILGSRARVSEILNRKRPLTLPMIRRLAAELKIPAEVLIQESRAA